MNELVLRDVEVEGVRLDVRLRGDRVVEIGPRLEAGAEPTLDGRGGALIPGLWDHHLHLLALAASYDSVPVGPPEVTDAVQLARVLRAADDQLGPTRWLRGVGYHESVAGPLDRAALDRLVPDRPTRIQHRSGAQWILNSPALDELGLVELGLDPGTGRLYGQDALVRRLDPGPAPPLDQVGRQLARHGITGVTDTTPASDPDYFGPLSAAVSSGTLPVRVMVTGAPQLDPAGVPHNLICGPAKILIADHDLPTLAGLRANIDRARQHGRAVALHCVTRVALILAVAALDDVGSVDGDRIEHGAVVPPDLVEPLRTLGLTVVTQPGFIADRGDAYLADVDDEPVDALYPAASLVAAGVALAGSSDAPFGSLDPWHALAAAIGRRTAAGTVLGPAERLDPARALDLFLGDASAPGGPVRRVAVGARADLCLLARPLTAVLRDPTTDQVVATFCGGRRTYPT